MIYKKKKKVYLAHSFAVCVRSLVPASASGEVLRKILLMVQGEGGAGVSHGKREKELPHS